jgi:hypothetical protein
LTSTHTAGCVIIDASGYAETTNFFMNIVRDKIRADGCLRILFLSVLFSEVGTTEIFISAFYVWRFLNKIKANELCVCRTIENNVFVALVIQRIKRMSRIILLSLACLAVPYFSTLSQKRYDLKKIELKICLFIFSTIFV